MIQSSKQNTNKRRLKTMGEFLKKEREEQIAEANKRIATANERIASAQKTE